MESGESKKLALLRILEILQKDTNALKCAITEQLDQMSQCGKLNPDYRNAVSVKKIATFAEGNLAF